MKLLYVERRKYKLIMVMDRIENVRECNEIKNVKKENK